MNLQNGYKVIYEKITDGKRTFYATKNNTCDPAVDTKLVEAAIGEYKLIYERAGRFYGSKTGIPTDTDFCFEGFDEVFKETVVDSTEDPTDTVVKENVTVTPDEPADEPVDEPTNEPEDENLDSGEGSGEGIGEE